MVEIKLKDFIDTAPKYQDIQSLHWFKINHIMVSFTDH